MSEVWRSDGTLKNAAGVLYVSKPPQAEAQSGFGELWSALGNVSLAGRLDLVDGLSFDHR